MDLVQDEGGEYLDSLGSLPLPEVHGYNGAAGGPSQLEKTFIDYGDAYEDDDEGPDEKSNSPALYLRKFWRKVSIEPVVFDCFRSPKTRSYACTLKLPMPQKEPQIFRSPPVYASKREAIRAMADYAMQCGVLGEAARSMALLDKTIDPYSLPGPSHGPFDGSSNPRFAPPGEITTHQSPVTLLNLAVQKYCVEVPNVVLNFVHQTANAQGGRLRGAIYRCELRVRISPDVHEAYATTEAFSSMRLAKEAVAQLALQEGVVILFKLHNSMTTKICRQLGCTIPATLEDHDTFEEENTAGLLSQLVQQVTRDPGALTSTFSELHSDTGDLYGAKVILKLSREDTRTFEMPPLFRNKKEAKECVCRLAVRLGLRKELENRMNLVQASHQAINGLDGLPSGSVGAALPSPPTENAVSRLNAWAQTMPGGSNCLSYDFKERPGVSVLGKAMTPRFGSSLTIRLKPDEVQKFESEIVFPSKKLAKEAVANLAVQTLFPSKSASGSTVETSHAGGTSPSEGTSPDVKIYGSNPLGAGACYTSQATSFNSFPSASYQAPRNVRVQDLPASNPQNHLYAGPPPPYIASSPAEPLDRPCGGFSPNPPNLTNISVRHVSNHGEQQHSDLHDNLNHPNLHLLRQHFLEAFGASGPSRIAFHLRKDQRSGLYSGSLRLELDGGDVRLFESESTAGSVASAKENLSLKALSGDLWKQLSVASQQPESSKTVKPAISGVPSMGSYHPVSYVHQMCQILLGTESRHKPDFEVFKPGDGPQFAARLTIPTVPSKTYTTSTDYHSKAAAREAVAALSIAEGLVDHLKAHASPSNPRVSSKNGGIAHPSASTSQPPPSDMMMDIPAPIVPIMGNLPHEKASYTEQLRSYCQAVERCEPVFQNSRPEPATCGMSRISVTIGQKVYELEVQGDQQLGSDGYERLAKRVLKHFSAQQLKD